MKHVLIIGGLGNLGSRLSDLLLSKSYKISILDKKEAIRSLENRDSPLEEFFYFENDKFFNHSGVSVEENQLSGITDVIVATRYRESSDNNYDHNPWTQDSISQLSISFENTIVNPIKIIYELKKIAKNHCLNNIIHIFSSNGFQISQQSLSYHLVNSAIPMVGKYISILHHEIELNYYLLEVGIIKFNDTEEPSNLLKSPSFPGLRIDELSTLIDFLVENSPRYLSGQVISLTGGRKFLDSTAAYEGVFGDLTVRKSSD
jgi:hypothetical protein